MENKNQILDLDISGKAQVRRRQLLPWWIKVFAWLFLVAGALTPIALIAGMFDYRLQLAIYGISTMQPLSVYGLIVSSLFLLKGAASFGLLFEKGWAITVAKIDAVIGICVCIFVMLIFPTLEGRSGTMSFRLELLLLIPYLVKVTKIGSRWGTGK